MNAPAATADRYDSRTITLHWLTAVLVVGLWTLGETIDFFPKGAPRIAARSLHICFGVAMAAVLVYRIGWRLGPGTRLPTPATHRLDALAPWVHGALYLLLLSTVLLGLANVWVRGDTVFGWVTIPAFDPANRDLRETVEDWHGLSANLLLCLAGLHAAAGILHHVVRRDRVLQRMKPAR